MSMDLIERKKNGDFSLSGFTLTRVGAAVPAKATEAEWKQAWEFIRACEGRVMWWIGDMLITAETKWGETYKKAVEESGYAEGTLRNAKAICAAIDLSFRNDKLSFAHHMQVSSLSPSQQKRWLAKAEKDEMTVAELRQAIRAKQATDRLESAAETKAEGWTVTANQAVVTCAALITDPPYGVLNEPWEPKKLEEFTRDWAIRWASCGAKCIAIFWSQNFLWEGRQWFDDSFTGYHFQQMLAWHYPNSMMRKAGPNFKNSWDPVFFYLKDGETIDITVHAETEAWGEGLADVDCMVAAIPQSNFNESNQKLHPAQKPVKVMRWLVSTLSFPGDLVADPFCGSGTTGIAAMQLGRKFHGIETDPDFLKLAKGRVAEFGKATE